jgi:hypothetical protein
MKFDNFYDLDVVTKASSRPHCHTVLNRRIKPQDGSDHLFGTDGTTRLAALPVMGPPAWLRGFGLLGRCMVPMSYREASVFGPMRSLMIFGLTPAFRAPPASCV